MKKTFQERKLQAMLGRFCLGPAYLITENHASTMDCHCQDHFLFHGFISFPCRFFSPAAACNNVRPTYFLDLVKKNSD